MGRINWQKSRKDKLPIEEKYEDGKILNNGRVVVHPKDRMDVRAAAAEREWLKKIGKTKI